MEDPVGRPANLDVNDDITGITVCHALRVWETKCCRAPTGSAPLCRHGPRANLDASLSEILPAACVLAVVV